MNCRVADAPAGCASCSIPAERQKCVNVSGVKDECPAVVLISGDRTTVVCFGVRAFPDLREFHRAGG